LLPEDPEVQAWLRRAMIVRVATRSPGGEAFLTPLWFVATGGRLFAGTGAGAMTVRNLRADPQVALLCDADRGPREDRVLRLRGRATLHDGYPSWRVLAQFGLKYYLAPGGLRCELRHARRWSLRQRYYAGSRPAVVEIAPESAEWLARPG
jgi:Pyridoxamine 5'-phosphate oxidase